MDRVTGPGNMLSIFVDESPQTQVTVLFAGPSNIRI